MADLIKPRHRPEKVTGYTYKKKTELGNVYIVINEDEIGPLEVFVNLGKSGTSLMALTEAIGRLISLALRASISPWEIVDQLSGIKSAYPTQQPDGSVVFSVPDAIAQALTEFLNEKSVNSGGQKHES
jgi:ribonucleoside-diphosphate reductase alpha chain